MLDHEHLKPILINQDRFLNILSELTPRQLEKLELERTITLDGLVKLLMGKTELFSPSLLIPEIDSLLASMSENTMFSTLIQTIFGGTDIDPFAGEKPLLKPTAANKNKITALRHGKYYLCFLTALSIPEGNKVAWETLRKRFEQQSMICLEQILNKLNTTLVPPRFTEEIISSIDQCFRHIHPQEDPPQTTPDPAACLRQLSMLFAEALLGRDISSAQCRQWVNCGFVSELPKKSLYAEELWDSLTKHFGSGVFALKRDSIQDNLIPDIKIQRDNREQVFQLRKKPDGSSISPLEEILREQAEHNLFLLCGQENSGVSGAGKTTSLRKLYYDLEAFGPVFIPLSMVYSTNSLRAFQKGNGCTRLQTWLSLQGLPLDSLQKLSHRLILLDGLDEITDPQGLQSLCDDLYELADAPEQRLVISSKLPPEKLASWEYLKRISSVWDRCQRCYVQPLRSEQKTSCMADIPLPLEGILTTPFLLLIYKDVQTFLHIEKTNKKNRQITAPTLISRWLPGVETLPIPSHEATLFYRYLAVQVCRWFDANKANDVQNEADAFFLMYALPAVAFQMELSRIYDSEFTPDVQPVDSTRVDLILDQSFSAFRGALLYYSAYKNNRDALLSGMEKMNKTGFYQGQAAAVLHREFDWDTFEYQHHFVNHSLQENLAAMHLSNLFFSAYNNAVRIEKEFMDFYTCPTYFLPQVMWEKAAHFLAELFAAPSALQDCLTQGLENIKKDFSPLAQYLLCNLAAGLCGALKLPKKSDWQTEADKAYQVLLMAAPDFAEKYRMDHVLNLCGQAQSLRATRPAKAAEKAREAIFFTRTHMLKNSDGYHALSKVYLEQIQNILNHGQADEQMPLPVPKEDFDFSCQIHDELIRLAGMSTSSSSPVFRELPPENLELAGVLLPILEKARLRLDAYQEKQFFHSSTVEFLLKASYTAKAHSIYAAISQGTSGAALNMLACFLENQQEELENHPSLPFFKKCPEFHLDMDAAELEYPSHHLRAFFAYRRIYNIRRGPQPYSARKLAQALLARRVRLNEAGLPVDGPGSDNRLTKQERKFLEEATRRACEEPRTGHRIPRIRFLHECIENPSEGEDISRLTEEAHILFQHEWALCGCQEKLQSGSSLGVDLNSVLMAAEYTQGYLDAAQPKSWDVRLCAFFQQQLQFPSDHSVIYTTGTRMRKEYLQEAWTRLCRLSDHSILRIRPQEGADERWYQVTDKLGFS